MCVSEGAAIFFLSSSLLIVVFRRCRLRGAIWWLKRDSRKTLEMAIKAKICLAQHGLATRASPFNVHKPLVTNYRVINGSSGKFNGLKILELVCVFVQQFEFANNRLVYNSEREKFRSKQVIGYRRNECLFFYSLIRCSLGTFMFE
jgi:hypothetical protein